MSHYDQSNGSYDPTANRPYLSHRFSSVSDISSSSSHRDSIVSLPSPPSESRPFSPSTHDEVDVSRVPLYRSGNSGVASITNSPVAYGSSSSLPSLNTNVSSSPGPMSANSSGNVLDTRSPMTPSSRGYNIFNRSPSVSYEPVRQGEGSSRRLSKRGAPKRKTSVLGFGHSAIPEHDEYDMSLMANSNGMGFGGQKTAYQQIAEDEQDFEPISHTGSFDVTSFVGPMGHDPPGLTEVQKLERGGILTGGLGQGFETPSTTISSTSLYAQNHYSPVTPTSPPGLSRSMSRAISLRGFGLARAPTLKNLGQEEANRRGEAVRVVVEEPVVDLSSFEGGRAPDPVSDLTSFDPVSVSRQSRSGTTLPLKTVDFFPQADWRPFSMTWPYLSALIIISLGLAGTTEYLLWLSTDKPLFVFDKAENLTVWNYFMFKYLPTICAVSFGVLWQVTDFEVKRLEAYYQLSKEGGALAAESINVDYITFFNFLRPIRALRYKHYAVAVSSVATLMAVSLIPTLQSACIRLSPLDEDRRGKEKGMLGIYIHRVFSRLLTSALAIIAICGSILLWQLSRRRSGLVADVKGIAGIAAMANRSHILKDFKDMDTATPGQIHDKLKTHRYLLRNSSLAPDTSVLLTQDEKDKYDASVVTTQNPHPLMMRLAAGIPFLIAMILFIAFIPIVVFLPAANVITDKVPWLLTAMAVCIKLGWGTLETDVRMMEPFYILSKRHASPKVLTLDYTAMAFGWMPIRAFSNGHYLVGAVGLGSVLAEILTVCSTSFANVSGLEYAQKLFNKGPRPDGDDDDPRQLGDGEETEKSFWVSLLLAVSILLFLCCVATTVFARRRHPFLPRQPNTISSVLAFIHQSKMLRDFVGTEKMNNDEMVEQLVGIKKTYGLGWFTGRDGENHCGIDEEELTSAYRHGENTKNANLVGHSFNDWGYL